MTTKNLSGKRVKIVRVAQDMKQSDLCAALSVDFDFEMSQTALSDIERGRRSISDVELDLFAKVLDVSPMWLLYGDDQPKFSTTPLKGK